MDNLAQSYYLQKDGSYKKARFDLNTGITVSNGGLNAPIPDMLKYLNFLMGNAAPEIMVAYNTAGETRTLDREVKEYIIDHFFMAGEK
ncbi:MAG TPA: hypothetical protein VK074_02635 [Fodinibius sp.]|nr:hypothetical protein [Fodinibius sp.]